MESNPHSTSTTKSPSSEEEISFTEEPTRSIGLQDFDFHGSDIYRSVDIGVPTLSPEPNVVYRSGGIMHSSIEVHQWSSGLGPGSVDDFVGQTHLDDYSGTTGLEMPSLMAPAYARNVGKEQQPQQNNQQMTVGITSFQQLEQQPKQHLSPVRKTKSYFDPIAEASPALENTSPVPRNNVITFPPVPEYYEKYYHFWLAQGMCPRKVMDLIACKLGTLESGVEVVLMKNTSSLTCHAFFGPGRCVFMVNLFSNQDPTDHRRYLVEFQRRSVSILFRVTMYF